MKVRFFMGIGVTLLLFAAGILLAGNPIGIFVDPASLLFALFVPHILISFTIPLSRQRQIIHGLLSNERMERTLQAQGVIYLNSLKRMVICCTIGTIILGMIGILANLEDMASVGPNMAVCLIVSFYAAVYILAVIEPLRLAADAKEIL